MAGHGFPYDDDERGGEARFEEELRMEEHDRELAARDRSEEMGPTRRAVMVEVPAGEGHPQIEFYRRLTGAPVSYEIRIEEE